MTEPTTPEHGLTPEVLGVDATQEEIDAAVAVIRDYCGWHVWPPRTEELTVDGEGGYMLTLPTLKLSDVTKVTENEIDLGADSYEWSASGDLKKVLGCWTTRWRGVKVALTHGNGACPFPAVVAGVASGASELEVIGPFQFGAASSEILSYRNTLDLHRLPALP